MTCVQFTNDFDTTGATMVVMTLPKSRLKQVGACQAGAEAAGLASGARGARGTGPGGGRRLGGCRGRDRQGRRGPRAAGGAIL